MSGSSESAHASDISELRVMALELRNKDEKIAELENLFKKLQEKDRLLSEKKHNTEETQQDHSGEESDF
ncbi:hypothetical protein Q7C36_022719 [Tachysurus vachellii]|uniref:Uncharacterized protein n=1 Tax=Tachysurus vachellii TaxID=175792 RepID=A0AA88LNQ4_TACVA|nr:hypothetical protein Q7C36_022719 [Tachysurus vachellii]